MFLFSCENISDNNAKNKINKEVEILNERLHELQDELQDEITELNNIDTPKIERFTSLPPRGVYDIANSIDIQGHWVYNQDLFYNEMKRLDEPKIDMSLYFNKVEMTFYNDGSFISYLDEQVTRGEWEIDDGHLSLKPDNQAMISYDYTINHSALYIYDRDYILAFSKRIISE